MSTRKKNVIGILCGILLLTVSCFLAFRMGKESRKESPELPEEALARQASVFGGETAVLTLAEDSGAYDGSAALADASLVPLADRLIEVIRAEEGVTGASAFYLREEGICVYHGMNSLTGGRVCGADIDFLDAAGLMVETGRGLTERDLKEKKQVAVLTGKAAQLLFGNESAIGKTFELEGRLFQVVGIAGNGEALEGIVVVPETLWPVIYQFEEPKAVVVRSEENLAEEAEYAARILNSMILPEQTIRYQVE